MAIGYLNSDAEGYSLRERRLIIPFSIVGHATAANKTVSTDLPACLLLSTEGLTADATAADSGTSFTTPVDSTGIFGCLVRNVGTVSKLLDVQVVNLSPGTATVTRKGSASTGVTASGNIAVSVDSNDTFATATLTGHLVVDFLISHN